MAKHYALVHRAEKPTISVHRVRASIDSLITAATARDAKEALFEALVKIVKNIPGYERLAVNTLRHGSGMKLPARVVTRKMGRKPYDSEPVTRRKPKRTIRVTRDKGVGKTDTTKGKIRAKLSQQDIRDIRNGFAAMLTTGDYTKWTAAQEIADRFRTVPSNILLIVERKTWKHVE